ncbi:MAG: sugar nucleotide-binding protein [Prolixibacteraceae bacterium]|nr:sugar nucleotide-binding protein [Prolixibacteraceae bacterium]
MKYSEGNWFISGVDGLIGRKLAASLELSGRTVLGTTCLENVVSEKFSFLSLSEDINDWMPPEGISIACLCAAVTSLDECRRNPAVSRKINVTNTVLMAEKLIAAGVFVVFLSTNLVFDGETPLRKENDPVGPKTEYGRQKAETERALLLLGKSVSIIRFSKIIWPEMPLVANWINLLKNGKPISPFADMGISPISLSYAVEALAAIGERKFSGITHVAAKEDITYEQMALYIARKMNADVQLVQPVKARESGLTLEHIPFYTSLDASRLRVELGMEPPDVWSVLDNIISVYNEKV